MAYEITDEVKQKIEQLTTRQDENFISAPWVKFLAENVFKRPVTVYDLETTSFIGDPVFGITEVAMLHFFPGNGVYTTTSLCNPVFPIKPEVVEKTGISDDMVKDAPLWEEFGGPLFHYLTSLGHVFIGYNNFFFDRKCVLEANKIAGFEGMVPADDQEYDMFPVSSMHMGKWTKLGEVATALGIKPERKLHRALSDVIVTAMIIDKLGLKYGMNGLKMKEFNKDQASRVGLYNKNGSSGIPDVEKDRILSVAREYLSSGNPDKTVNGVILHLNATIANSMLKEKDYNFILSDLIDNGMLKLCSFDFDEGMIADGMKVLTPEAISRVWAGNNAHGKLKPLMELISSSGMTGKLSYIDIRECLARNDIKWGTLKVELENITDLPFLQTPGRGM